MKWSDSALLLSMIDLLAVPSLWWEPQGRVVAEAGLADIPVLTTGHGGLGEGIGRDASGWVVPATATAWHEFFEGYLAEGGNPLPMVERAGTSSSATQAEVIASLLEAKGDRTVG